MIEPEVRAGVVAATATLLGALALAPVFSSGAWFPPVLAVVVVVLAGGVLLRTAGPLAWGTLARGRPAPDRLVAAGVVLVPVGQLALVGCLLTALYAPQDALAGFVPTAASLADLAGVLADGGAEIREQATPALPLTGLVAVTVVFVGLVAVIVDLITVAGQQAAVAGLGLLVLFCVPVATITGSIGLVAVAGPGAALALLLWADQRRRLAPPGGARRGLLGTGTVAAVRIGVAALATGAVLGALVPTLAEGSFATGLGGGSGNSTGTSLDPAAALRGQLTLDERIDLLRLETATEDPAYLRAVALDDYDAEEGWTLSNLDGEISVADDDELAPLPGRQETRTVTARVTALEHDDRFLPVLNSVLSVRLLSGDGAAWRFDPATGTVFGRGNTTAGQTWELTAEEPRPGAGLLAAAAALPLDDRIQERFTALPELDPSVTDLVAGLTSGAQTPYDRVRAVFDFLTDRSEGFLYSLSTEPGTGGDDLADFLRLRRGYCEQYAGAMAVMVRAAGVPARVALGYTPGSEQSDGSRLITSDDAHAWVEVYFDGLGWVPFDPTPIAADRAVDLPWAPRLGDLADPAVPQPAPAPNAPVPAPAPRTDRADGAPTAGGTTPDDAGVPRELVLGLSGVALVLVLAAVPGGVRLLQRRRRVGRGDAGALWDELTATATDLGRAPHPSWTPARTARELAGATPAVGEAAVRLARAEERASYGPAGREAATPGLVADLHTARRGLLRAAPLRTRLRAQLWPGSLLAGLRDRSTGWQVPRPRRPRRV